MTDNSNAAPERYGDRERNRLLNQCSCDLESIIYGHDPEIHNLNNRVWDRLDRLAMDIEARAADLARAQVATAYEAASPFKVGEAAIDGMLDRRGLREPLSQVKLNDPEVWVEICEEAGKAAIRALAQDDGK